MKVLFVSGNLCNGGAQRVISVIASKLADWGHDVNLLLFSRNENEYPISEKVKITALGESYEEYRKMSLISRMLYIRRYLKKTNPQVAVGFLEGGYALYLCSFGLKFKKVASSRIDPKILFNSKSLRSKINKIWFRSADCLVLQTNRQKEHVDDTLKAKGVVIANPVSDHALEVKPIGDFSVCQKFVMAGRLTAQKNYEMAINAMNIVNKEFPNVTLDIYGKGTYLERLQQMVNDYGLDNNIKFCGWTTDTAKTYSHYDAYLMTSNHEGMPNALMEAMAVGLPCISTNCDTGPEDLIADGQNGYLVPVGDAKAFADKMIEVINMPPKDRLKIAEAAYKTMNSEFNSDVIAKKWLELMEGMIR